MCENTDERPEPQLVYSGKRFGKLTVMYDEIPDSNRTSAIALMRAACRCDCGKLVKTYINNLISGTVTNCGCQDEYDVPDEYRSRVETLSEEFNVNIGIALSYVRRGMTSSDIVEEEALARPAKGLIVLTTHENVASKRSAICEQSAGSLVIEGFLGSHSVSYKKYLCRCGRTIYLRKRVGRFGAHDWPCQCEVIHERYYGRVHTKASVVDIRYKEVPSKKPWFDRTKCTGAGRYGGLCAFYLDDPNGARGCLDELAHGRRPTRMKPDHACYKPSRVDNSDDLESSYSGLYELLKL